jgi:hypothetical protein
MATVKEEADDAAGECGISLPPSWLGTSNDGLMFQRLVRSIARDLLDRHAWTGASATATFAPLVETASFTLPTDFNRLQEEDNAVFEVSPNRRPVIPMVSDGTWEEMKAWGSVGAQRYYRKGGGALEFYRPAPAGSIIKISYVSKNWIEGGKSVWTDEVNDTPVFPSQLIRFGLIYRWRRQKGLRFEDDQAEYEAILARAIGDDRPRRIIRTEGPGMARAHPMRVPVPDFIPSGS